MKFIGPSIEPADVFVMDPSKEWSKWNQRVQKWYWRAWYFIVRKKEPLAEKHIVTEIVSATEIRITARPLEWWKSKMWRGEPKH